MATLMVEYERPAKRARPVAGMSAFKRWAWCSGQESYLDLVPQDVAAKVYTAAALDYGRRRAELHYELLQRVKVDDLDEDNAVHEVFQGNWRTTVDCTTQHFDSDHEENDFDVGPEDWAEHTIVAKSLQRQATTRIVSEPCPNRETCADRTFHLAHHKTVVGSRFHPSQFIAECTVRVYTLVGKDDASPDSWVPCDLPVKAGAPKNRLFEFGEAVGAGVVHDLCCAAVNAPGCACGLVDGFCAEGHWLHVAGGQGKQEVIEISDDEC